MDVYRTGLAQAFSRASGRPEGSSGNDFLEAILRERPDLREKIEAGELTAYYPEQGGQGYVVIIGDEVFKGPRSEDPAGYIDREMNILKALTGKGLPVPEVTCVGKESIFFGMTRMPGISLSAGADNLSSQQMQNLGEDIADFMIGMAKVLPLQDGKFAAHNDMNSGNIFIDPETGRLTAMIDFGRIQHVEKDMLYPYGLFLRSDELRDFIRADLRDKISGLDNETRQVRGKSKAARRFSPT